MTKKNAALRSHCPINFGLEIFGDRWSLLVLRDVMLKGKCTFKEFQQSEEGIASNILAQRLHKLVASGLLTQEKSLQDQRKLMYQSTQAAKALLPVLTEMAYWGAKHDSLTAAPAEFVNAYEKDRPSLLAALASMHTATRRLS